MLKTAPPTQAGRQAGTARVVCNPRPLSPAKTLPRRKAASKTRPGLFFKLTLLFNRHMPLPAVGAPSDAARGLSAGLCDHTLALGAWGFLSAPQFGNESMLARVSVVLLRFSAAGGAAVLLPHVPRRTLEPVPGEKRRASANTCAEVFV